MHLWKEQQPEDELNQRSIIVVLIVIIIAIVIFMVFDFRLLVDQYPLHLMLLHVHN